MALPVRLRPIPHFSPKWTEATLRARCELEPRAFERGFRLRAYSDEEISFPDYVHCRVPGVSLGEIQRSSWPCFTGVDLSGKKRPGNAVVTVKVDPATRRRYPIDVRCGKWKSNETCEQITEVNALYRPQVIMVEDNGYQAAIIEWAEATKAPWWTKIEATTTTSETKFSQELGLPVLQTEFKRRAWVFSLDEFEGARVTDPHPRGTWARMDYEIRNHPVAATSDLLMSLLFCRQGIELFSHQLADTSQGVGDVTAR